MHRDTMTRNKSEFYNRLHWDNRYVCNNSTVHIVYRETINTHKIIYNTSMNKNRYSMCNKNTNKIPVVGEKQKALKNYGLEVELAGHIHK